MEKPRYLIIPKGREEEVRALLRLSAHQLREVLKATRSRDSLREGHQTYEVVAETAGIGNAEAVELLRAADNLCLQRDRYKLSVEQLLADLQAVLPTEWQALDEERRSALADLLAPSEEELFIDKAERLRYGQVPHLLSARTVCDVRPVFNQERTAIEGAMLVTIVEMDVHQREDQEYSTVFVQLTPAALGELKRSLEDAERKLGVLKAWLNGKVEVFA